MNCSAVAACAPTIRRSPRSGFVDDDEEEEGEKKASAEKALILPEVSAYAA